jgi:hypothetical protein
VEAVVERRNCTRVQWNTVHITRLSLIEGLKVLCCVLLCSTMLRVTALNEFASRHNEYRKIKLLTRQELCSDYSIRGQHRSTRLFLQRSPLAACSPPSSSTGSTGPAGISCLSCASNSPSGTYSWAIIGAPSLSSEKSGRLLTIVLSFCKSLLLARRFFCLFINSSATARIAASPRRPHATPIPA